MNLRRIGLLGSTIFALSTLTLPAWAADPAATGARYGSYGIDATAMNPAVKPGDDFFRYVNGTWLDTTEIAPDRTSAGVNVVLADQAELQVRQIVEDMARNPQGAGRIGQQVGDFYASWMDEAGVEARGTAPLSPYLGAIAAVRTKADLQRLFATIGYTTPVEIGILPDPADTTRYVAFASQAGLGLPNRDYYLLPDAKYVAFRKAYRAYVVKIQQLAGIADAEAKADRIIALEAALAKDHWAPERRRDIKAIYNPMNRQQMAALAPQFDWGLMLATSGLDKLPTVVMAETTAIQSAGKLLDSVPLARWKEYLAYHFVSSYASYLPKAFDEAKFDFYSRTLRDQPKQRDRWKRGVQMLNGSMGEAIGQIYVERHYPPESDRQMGELIDNLRASLKVRLEKLSWMDAPTREQALLKLSTFDPRIGHPKKWIDYSSIKIVRGDLLGNAKRSEQFAWDLQLSRLGKPVDRDLWEMTPQMVNAYYDPLMNQITFPAAILQPPYFDPKADPAINYGAIGAIIGHEIGHGFDDQGRQFDEKGRIRDWWTKEAGERFAARTRALADQFSAYEPIPGVQINGALTMGENIGDLGGIEMAYGAYRQYVADHGPQPVINGVTGDQRFFLAYAQAWRQKRREGALREQLLTDPHSPAEFRVNGIVRNVDAWYEAFGVKPGDKMYLPPEQRVHIW